ncbi:MAG: DUF3772 domain-containing protein, partial [Methyloligellaceae bacterium]
MSQALRICCVYVGVFLTAGFWSETHGQDVKAPDADWAAEIIASGAAEKIVTEHLTKLKTWIVQVDGFEKAVGDEIVADEKLKELLDVLERTRSETRDFVSKLKPKLEDVKARLAKLGPLPKEGEPREAEPVATKRRQLGRETAAYDGLVKRADLVFVRSGQLIDAINTKRRRRFARRLLEPVPDFYSSTLWQQAFRSISVQNDVAIRTLGSWIDDVAKSGFWRLGVMIGLAAAAAGILQLLVGRVMRWPAIRGFPLEATPSLAERGARILRKSLLAIGPVVAATTILYVGANALGVLAISGKG